mmetsp:Transcript_96459/g.259050  ORF Transcript_96459/g.259050 Transcript_96459/m.259050 type:complete len:357 (+) Transcript_96459:47-1117(+)
MGTLYSRPANIAYTFVSGKKCSCSLVPELIQCRGCRMREHYAKHAEAHRPIPLEECARIKAEDALRMIDTLIARLPLSALVVFASTLGPLALAPLRIASRAHHATFHPRHFVPNMRKYKLGDDLGKLNYKSKYSHDQVLSSSIAMDNTFLAIRPRPGESEHDHKLRLNRFFQTPCACWDCDVIAKSMLFPVSLADEMFSVYKTRSEFHWSIDAFPLHAAVLHDSVCLARLFLHFGVAAGCEFNAASTHEEMSPLFLAVLVKPDAAVYKWIDLMLSAGVRLNDIDSLLCRRVFSFASEFALVQDGEPPAEWMPLIQAFIHRLLTIFELIHPEDCPTTRLREFMRIPAASEDRDVVQA